MGKPFQLGRKALALLLIVAILWSSFDFSGSFVQAAPFIPGGKTETEQRAGTLESLIRNRTGRASAFQVDATRSYIEEKVIQRRNQATSGSNADMAFGITGMGVWEAPGRVRLRWMPKGSWIPKDGYTLIRIIDGQPTALVSGLGTRNPLILNQNKSPLEKYTPSSGAYTSTTTFGMSAAVGPISSSVKAPLLPKPAADTASTNTSSSDVLQFGGESVSAADFVQSIHENTMITDEVRQLLKKRNLLGANQSDAAVEQALDKAQSQTPVSETVKVRSGREGFVSRLQGALETPNQPKLSAPTTSSNTLPTVLNRNELAKVAAPKPSPTVPRPEIDAKQPEEDANDPVNRMLGARREVLTTANLNFSAAVASGLGFLDVLPKLENWIKSVEYLVIPNSELASLTKLRELPTPQISVPIGPAPTLPAPLNLEGYGLDGQVALRWDDADNELNRMILAGYIVERKLSSERQYTPLNSNDPVVRMYARDEEGTLNEAEVLYSDLALDNGDAASYRVRGLDLFGRVSEPSDPIAIEVLKTLPPPTPGLEQPELMVTQRTPIDIKAMQTAAPSVALAPSLPGSPGKKPELVDLETRQREQELTQEQQAKEARIAAIRKAIPGTGVMLFFEHSFEEKTNVSAPALAQSTAQKSGYLPPEGQVRQLAEGLSEYLVYRSEALGKGEFSEPNLIATISATALKEPFGSLQSPDDGVFYYDTKVSPGYYYAYWVTAKDKWGNESPAQAKPQVVGYPTTTIPQMPQGLGSEFSVNEELTAPQPKIAGYNERLKVKAYAGLNYSDRFGKPPALGTALTGKDTLNIRDVYIKRIVHRVVAAAADEVRPDGSLTVAWTPSTDPEVIGYQVYRAHDPAATAVTAALSEAELDNYQWTLMNVNPSPDKRDQMEQQVTTSNQLRDLVPVPARGSYYYLVYLIYPDTFGATEVTSDEKLPYVEGGEVVVRWNQISDPQLAGYRVYRTEVPAPSSTQPLTAQELRWDMIAQLVNGQEYTDVVDQSKVHYYQYKVSAVSIWGVESAAAVTLAPVRIATTIPPAVPAFLTPIAQPGQVQLRWKPVYDATQYIIYRAEQSIPEIDPIDLANSVLEAAQQRSRKSAAIPDALRDKLVKLAQQLKDLKDPEALREKIVEIIAGLSDEEQLSLFNIIRKRYGILALSPYHQLDQQSASEIKWQPVQTLTLTNAENEAKATAGEVMTWSDSSGQYPGTYLYAIEAVNEDQLSSGLSSPVTVGPQKAVGPAAPDPVILKQDGGLVQLSWPAYTLKTPMGYLVYKSVAKDGQYQQCSPLLVKSEFSEQIAQGEEWWYRVVIIDEVGLMSAATTAVKAARPLPTLLPDLGPGGKITGTKPGWVSPELPPIHKTAVNTPLLAPTPLATTRPAAPVISAGETGSTTITLSWSAASGVTQYKVYGYKTEQPEKLLATADGKASSCIVTGLTPSTRYYFYVVAVNELGDSSPSKVVSATTKAPSTTQPQWGKLTLEVTTTTLDSITLSWSDTGSAPEGYRIYYYKTEQPEQLLQTVTGSTTSFTAKGLTANTKYFFYITAYKDGKESLPSNVASGIAKVQTTPTPTPDPTPNPNPNPQPIPNTPGSTIKIAGYTLTNVQKVPLAGGAKSDQTVGLLTIAGLSPIPVRLDIQELSGDTLTKGSVSLWERYEHKQGDAKLVIDKLTLTGSGPAKITGQLAIPGVTPIRLTDSTLSADSKIALDAITTLWVGDYQLTHLKGTKAQFFDLEPGLLADSGWLESSLGQITLTNQRLQISSASSIRIDFGGRINGLFDKVVTDGKPIDLVVPRLTGLTISKATLKLVQGVVDPQVSQIEGKYNLPFVTGELTSTVVTPTDNSGANRPPTPGEQVINPGDMFERFNFGGITSNSTVKGLNEKGQQALKGSMNHLLQSIKSANKANITAQAPAQTLSPSGVMLMSMVNTFTMRYFSDIPFAIPTWDGKGILPTQEQTGSLDKVLVKELQSRSAIVSGGGMDKSSILQLEAAKTKLSLPSYQLVNTPEQVSIGVPGYRGFEILEGFVTLPPTSVSLRNPAQGTTFRLPVPASSLFYSRNGLTGRVDTEAVADTSADIWLNKDVAATMSGAAIDLENNQVQWSMTGSILVPQLGQVDGTDRKVRYGAFSDPQGGLIFHIKPDGAPVPNGTGRSMQITGGTIKGLDLYLDGILNVAGQINFKDLAFVGLKLYMGSGEAPKDPAYGQGLAATPTPGKVKEVDMQAEGLKVEKGDNGWEMFITGATTLADNLPLNKGTILNLDANLDSETDALTAKLNYTYEQFMTIDITVKYEKGELRGDGEFWFITGEQGDQQRSQATGLVQARIGKKDVEYTDENGQKQIKKDVSYWLFRVAYGQTTKVWRCDKCENEFHGSHPPVNCPFTAKNGSQCTGTKDSYKGKYQCKECKKIVYDKKEAPKKCSGTDAKPCFAKDSYKQVMATATKEEAEGAGLMLGPVQINTIMGMVGYNVEVPMNKKDGTFQIPTDLGLDEKLYEWKISPNNYKFFAASATMTIWHNGEKFLTLDPVKLVVASGPSVEMEVGVKRDGKLLVWGKLGYYHTARRFYLAVKIPELKLPAVGCGLKDLNLILEFAPNKQIINLSYPEMVKVIIPGSPWDFAGGFAYEQIDDNTAIKLRARVRYGFEGEKWGLYVVAKIGLTVDAQLEFGEDDFSFILMMMLDASVAAGIKIRGKNYEVLKAYVSVAGYLGKTKSDVWWAYGEAYLEYHLDLFLFETSGSFTWTCGSLPEGITPDKLPQNNRTMPREENKDKGKEGDKGKAA